MAGRHCSLCRLSVCWTVQQWQNQKSMSNIFMFLTQRIQWQQGRVKERDREPSFRLLLLSFFTFLRFCTLSCAFYQVEMPPLHSGVRSTGFEGSSRFRSQDEDDLPTKSCRSVATASRWQLVQRWAVFAISVPSPPGTGEGCVRLDAKAARLAEVVIWPTGRSATKSWLCPACGEEHSTLVLLQKFHCSGSDHVEAKSDYNFGLPRRSTASSGS